MNWIAFSAVAMLSGQPQIDDAEEGKSPVIVSEGPVIGNSLTIPSEFAFAIVPYVRCLSAELMGRQTLLRGMGDPSLTAEVKGACFFQRDEAIFLAATALAQKGEGDVAARMETVFQTLEDVESVMLIPVELDEDGKPIGPNARIVEE
ncbi:hypothetical protein [Erythrobacter donghaensis]|jgi:hypothetical protein|uniref:hypothetical protein n=1 Tax=Erythrobacter donghaensis TaxID=267135 RepID=UPI00093B407B|nr:hypothetical protein [Erythrobacter donghaensis]